MKQTFLVLVFSLLLCFTFSQPLEAQLCPDLIIRNITMTPTNPTTATKITFRAVVHNIGHMTAKPSIAAIRVGGETKPREFRIPRLKPGRSRIIVRVQRLTIAKTYRTTFYADYKKGIRECWEKNNSQYINFRVTKGPSGPSQDPGQLPTGCPDLIIRKFTMTPTYPTTSTDIRFTAVITNIGIGIAPASVAAIRVGGETNPIKFRVPALPALRNITVTRVKRLTRAQDYRTTAYADYNKGVRECRENNNTKYINFQVTSKPGCPDLTIMRIYTIPANPTPSTSNIVAKVIVKNIGRARAPAAWVRLRVNAKTQPNVSIPSLNAGQSHTATFGTLLMGYYSPTINITALVGYQGLPADCNQGNDKKEINITKPERQCADPAIVGLTTPNVTLGKDRYMKITVVIKNKGNLESPPGSLILLLNDKRQKSVRTSKLRPGDTDTIEINLPASLTFNRILEYFITPRWTKKVIAKVELLPYPSECDTYNNKRSNSFTVYKK